ncbi:RtcB family protein [Funiculus sociatus GB2-A5]|uniref:tRNA-splicing ligase RtcB n=1 Tax=Funiculus sociatus GB2-A5 TaxID=2933946 RepID=A0ABV0JSR7_9CYAN|nr:MULTISPECIES: RtcB family protein [unclassified Trichocoleus]MBD1906893.1 RtcB family protein [Trichocoleus sp. FACHB-832]MBD2063404.1 RtcB family protein [Trichocoleus sp. FACHB-6]
MPIKEFLEKISDTVWEIPVSYKEGMRVPARIYGTEKIISELDEAVYDQVTNVATLPGITKYAMCMPDGHFGYGFPIGGVAAMDVEKGGVISPGGIGFDINCGMRLMVTNLTYHEVKPYIKKLVDRLYERVPAGVGSSGFVKLSRNDFRQVVEQGAQWCVNNGYGWEEDLELIEENGCIKGADSAKISDKAIDRGFNQIGTLGSGNHYLEIQVARKLDIFDPELAKTMGITMPDQVVVMFHCGSRGFGHQVATDYLQRFLKVMDSKYGIKILDRELACAPFDSPEGQAYFSAMKCGINMSYANRQVILHRIREVFSEIFERSAEDLGMHMVYDVAHNTAKLENHVVDGKKRSLLVHRKGATRAFAPGMADIPERYKNIGQPVIIGGSMETGSYLLVGVPTGDQTFFSTAHGSGRTMSRTKARKAWKGETLLKDMQKKGIYVRSTSMSGLAEEAGAAYKDIDDVIEAAELAGISKKVVRLTPIGNIKG